MRSRCLALTSLCPCNCQSRTQSKQSLCFNQTTKKKKKSTNIILLVSTSLMASNDNNDAPNDFPRGPRKAQLRLPNILLNPISSASPCLVHQFHIVNASEKEESSATASSSSTSLSVLNVSEYDSIPMGYNLLDLNLPPPPETHQDSPSPALHGAVKVQECPLQSPEETKSGSMVQDESFENEMETNNVGLGNNLETAAEKEERTEIKGVGEREESKSEIRFGALLDAVECAMEEYGSKHGEPSKGAERNESNGRKRQSVKWKTVEEEVVLVAAAAAAAAAEAVSTSPVVKSNRGRIQVLPHKYRDSVIEPLTHLSSRHNRSSTIGPPKRRSM